RSQSDCLSLHDALPILFVEANVFGGDECLDDLRSNAIERYGAAILYVILTQQHRVGAVHFGGEGMTDTPEFFVRRKRTKESLGHHADEQREAGYQDGAQAGEDNQNLIDER